MMVLTGSQIISIEVKRRQLINFVIGSSGYNKKLAEVLQHEVNIYKTQIAKIEAQIKELSENIA